MKNITTLETLYDFKKELMDVIPGIVRMTVNDCHGGIENLIVENIELLEERHWKAVFNSKYNLLFTDGIPQVSWNTDRSKILCTLAKAVFDNHRNNFEKITVDSWDETWYHIKVMYLRTPKGTVIKYRREDPICWTSYSNTRFYGSVVQLEDVPEKATHTVVLFVCDKFGTAHISDQYTGSMSECEDWIKRKAGDYSHGMPDIKIIKLED